MQKNLLIRIQKSQHQRWLNPPNPIMVVAVTMGGDLLSTPPLLSTNRTAAIVALFHSPNLSPIIVLAFKIYWHNAFFSVSMKLRLTYASVGLTKCQNWRNISAQWMEHDPQLSMLIHLGEALSASWEETFSQFFFPRETCGLPSHQQPKTWLIRKLGRKLCGKPSACLKTEAKKGLLWSGALDRTANWQN